MNHSYFKNKISAYKDMGLNPEETQLIEQHLSGCKECQELLERLNSLDRLVKRESTLDSGEYWENLAAKIDERIADKGTKVTEIAESRGSFSLMWKLVATAASVAFLVFIGINKDEILSPLDNERESPVSNQFNDSPVSLGIVRSAETNDSALSGDPEPKIAANAMVEQEKAEVSGRRDEADGLEKSDRIASAPITVADLKPNMAELSGGESSNTSSESKPEKQSDAEAEAEEDSNYKKSASKMQRDSFRAQGNIVFFDSSPEPEVAPEDILNQFSLLDIDFEDSSFKSWREERDDLLILFPQYQIAMDGKPRSRIFRSRKSVSGYLDLAEESESKEKNETASESRLLELLKNILAITDNKDEADSALAIIRLMAVSGDSESRVAAKSIIDSVESLSEETNKSDK